MIRTTDKRCEQIGETYDGPESVLHAVPNGYMCAAWFPSLSFFPCVQPFGTHAFAFCWPAYDFAIAAIGIVILIRGVENRIHGQSMLYKSRKAWWLYFFEMTEVKPYCALQAKRVVTAVP